MGMMTATGLAGVIAKWFIAFSTPETLPFWGYHLLDHHQPLRAQRRWPLGGAGALHRAGGGRFHVNRRRQPRLWAMEKAVANMIQPFWALPLLAIAGIGMRQRYGLHGD